MVELADVQIPTQEETSQNPKMSYECVGKSLDSPMSQGSTSHPHIRRRKLIPHGHCVTDDSVEKPRKTAVDPQYTDCGPDWKSTLRHIPPPADESRKDEVLWPDHCSRLRTFPGMTGRTFKEWSNYPSGCHTGKQCVFQGSHLRSAYGADEVTPLSYGCKRQKPTIDQRNGLCDASQGDKQYQAVEYEPDFFKNGSSVPAVNFGHAYVKKADTFIPLMPLPDIPCEPFTEKEKRRLKSSEKEEVFALDNWKPAPPLDKTIADNLFHKK